VLELPKPKMKKNALQRKRAETRAITNRNRKGNENMVRTPQGSSSSAGFDKYNMEEVTDEDGTDSVASNVVKIEECLYLTQQITQWQKDVKKKDTNFKRIY